MRVTTHLLRLSIALFVFAFAAPPTLAAAQRAIVSRGVETPGISLASPSDAFAAEINPGAIGLLDSWSLVYQHVGADDDDASLLGAGDAVYLTTPLLLGLHMGAFVESVRPTEASGESDRGMLGLALAYGGQTGGAGLSLRFIGSQDPTISDFTTVDLGFATRWASWLASAFMVRDITGPLDLARAGAGRSVPATFVLAIGIRPTGDDYVTVDLSSSYDTDGRWGLRGALELPVPYVGRIYSAANIDQVDEEDERALLVTAGLAIDWGRAGLGGGVLLGDGLEDAPGWYVTARMGGVRQRGIPIPRHVADMQVEGIGERGVLSLVAALDAALHDEQVAGVFLRLRDTDIGSAYAQEVRYMIDALARAGKPVVCHLDNGSQAEYYACSGAAKIFVDPGGGIRFWGIDSTTLLLGELLELVSLRADFVRIGAYKSAPEQLTARESSEPAREQRTAYMNDVFHRIVQDTARGRGMSPARVRELIDGGPYVRNEAVDAGLVDGLADEWDMDDTLDDAFGDDYRVVETATPLASPRWGLGRQIGVVVIDGDIVDGDNVDIPLIEIHQSGGRTIVEAIDELAANPAVAAIILRVDSPGGSVLASDQIWRAVMRARQRKPVIASLGAVAASGGYYVASAADEIWADPSTVTGSIGVFFGKVDGEALADRIGVSIETVSRGRRAGADSIYRPFTADERAMLAEKIRLWYRLFLQRIAAGRGMEIDAIDAVARGRVWSGDAALRHGLVDHLGGFGAALARVRELAELRDDAPIIALPDRPGGLLDYVLADTGLRVDDVTPAAGLGDGARPLPLPPELLRAARFLAVLSNVRDGIPLALHEEVSMEMP